MDYKVIAAQMNTEYLDYWMLDGDYMLEAEIDGIWLVDYKTDSKMEWICDSWLSDQNKKVSQ